MSVDKCPIIHKVTDESEDTAGGGAKCPVSIDVSSIKQAPVNIEEFEEDPSQKEYKKLKRVMSVITGFYRKGTDQKRMQHEYILAQLATLDSDMDMVRAQVMSAFSQKGFSAQSQPSSQRAALNAQPLFSKHRKVKEYETVLERELEDLAVKREGLVAKREEYFELWEWSKVIVQVCEWLERNLDVYCRESLGLDVKVPAKGDEELPPATVAQYCKGLDEITYNLAESEDFFKASVDGRLRKYHCLERKIVEAQLAAVRSFPEESERRQHVESELLKDLDYVEENIRTTTENRRHREKMLWSHSEYLKVLEFHKQKLRLLHPETIGATTVFDSQYDIVFEYVDGDE